MGRMYTAVFKKAAVAAIEDMFEVNAPADAIVLIHKIIITQSSDAGDAESKQVEFMIHRGSTSGTGGAGPTASPLEFSDTAFAGTVETNNTTQSTDGTIIHREAVNVMAGFFWPATPEERLTIPPSGRIVVSLEDISAVTMDMVGTIYFEELG